MLDITYRMDTMPLRKMFATSDAGVRNTQDATYLPYLEPKRENPILGACEFHQNAILFIPTFPYHLQSSPYDHPFPPLPLPAFLTCDTAQVEKSLDIHIH